MLRYSPLHLAAEMGELECMEILIGYGASVNEIDRKGMSK